MEYNIIKDLGTIFSVFGGIFLIITIINYKVMQKEIVNPNCGQDIKDVTYNKKWGKNYLIIYSSIVLLGIILLIISCFA